MSGPVLVFSGGNALGAYHAGAWYSLEAAGIEPSWLVGTSIGGVTAAILAGTSPERRYTALRYFWERVASADAASPLLPEVLRRPLHYGQALASRLFGRAALYFPRPMDLTGGDERPSLFDVGPMRRLLQEVIDFDRLNEGELRVTITAVDLASGEEVIFDNRSMNIELDHVMAGAALIPDFPPVEIDGRLHVDGGLSVNLPIHLPLAESLATPDRERLTCFALDLFSLSAPLPRSILQAAQRQSDLIFASQTSRTYRSMSQLWSGAEPGADVFHVSYLSPAGETTIKGFDFSAGILDRRRAAGCADMNSAIDLWRASGAPDVGLTIHTVRRGARQ